MMVFNMDTQILVFCNICCGSLFFPFSFHHFIFINNMSINKARGTDKQPTWEESKVKNDDNHQAYRSGTDGVRQKVESYLAQGIIEYYA